MKFNRTFEFGNKLPSPSLPLPSLVFETPFLLPSSSLPSSKNPFVLNRYRRSEMASRSIKSIVYHGETCLGEVDVISMDNQQNFYLLYSKFKVIRISHLSPPGERCPPLSVLQTISPFSVRCKILAKTIAPDSPIHLLYMTCFKEYRSAIVVNGSEDLHLVAMPSQVEQAPCFWCFSVQAGLYNPCLGMLNLRCLAIVFDLDETLIVANTMKSFDDKIDALSRKIDAEKDPIRISGMSAELKRYVEDRHMLKQYIEIDTITDNGMPVSAQNEQVLQLPGAQTRASRPVIRLSDRNIVLTRIIPEIRDTSVFVRLRPAWEDLRSYLTAKGRKRFEVYVCTMAERDYAFEMWRLLDPESNLICTSQLSSRITCVKPGFRKSLTQVFQDGACHPKMAMVIDDRLQVWDDKDQPHVHVVPPFTPYYAPQAEMANAVPVLCVARNVACNVRGGFFREFDENLLRKVFEIRYENETSDLPCSPDVTNYVVSEDKSVMQNNIQEPPIPAEGMMGPEVEEKFRQATYPGNGAHTLDQAHPQSIVNGSSQNGAVIRGQGSSNIHESTVILALLQIGRICESKVEFKPIVGSSKDFMFSVEVLFDNERIGVGMGKTRKEAETLAAENGLRYLSDSLGDFEPTFASSTGDIHNSKDDEDSFENENGFIVDDDIGPILDEPVQQNNICETSDCLPQHSPSENLSSVLSSIRELCVDSEKLVFQDQPSVSVPLDEGKYYFQLELSGEILGSGTGSTIEEAKFQAAEVALKTVKAAAATGEKRLPSTITQGKEEAG